jgi:hypothetical protein
MTPAEARGRRADVLDAPAPATARRAAGAVAA